jgi:hypothetical protein
MEATSEEQVQPDVNSTETLLSASRDFHTDAEDAVVMQESIEPVPSEQGQVQTMKTSKKARRGVARRGMRGKKTKTRLVGQLRALEDALGRASNALNVDQLRALEDALGRASNALNVPACGGAAQHVKEELCAQEDTYDPWSKVLISPACADVIPNHSEDQGSKACEQLLQLQDQVQLLQKQMRLMVAEAKVKDAAIRKKDEEMEAKDKEIARLRPRLHDRLLTLCPAAY